MSESEAYYPAESTPVAGHMQNGLSNHERVVPQLPRELRAVKDANSYKHHGRNIIVCLDGTGDKFDADNSNIVHFVSCLKKSDPSQSIYYQSGIGTYDGGGLSNGINAGLDMAVGSGLGVHIRDAYKYLMQTFKEGDKISLFGFSRGAYTARCLAGMVHKVGLLPAHNSAQVPFAYEYYKDDTENGWKMSADFKRTFCVTVNIDFIGVFDSVGSIGFIPRKLPLSSTPICRARHFRHAMALDERRAKFKVCRYQQKAGDGWMVLAEEKERDKEREEAGTDVLEVWFAGCHADVGGGAVKNEVRHKLSQIPLRWMIRQCFDCNTGIIFKAPRLAEEGIDVHTLWPQYTQLPKPSSAPPTKDLLEKKANGGLGPIIRRASVLEPVKHDEPNGMHHVKLWEDDEKLKHSSDWVPEQVEDYFDAMEDINDQLVQAKGWWALEVWPVKVRMQPKDSEAWIKKVRCNMGRYRACQEHDPKLHWTVEQRISEKVGENKVRADQAFFDAEEMPLAQIASPQGTSHQPVPDIRCDNALQHRAIAVIAAMKYSLHQSALLTLPALLSTLVLAVPTVYEQHPLHIPHNHNPEPAFDSPWRAVVGHILDAVWRPLHGHSPGSKAGTHCGKPRPPPHALAKYGGDIVVRFNISTPEEAEYMAEAIDNQLLDVWEFSHDWVDIRMAKEEVPYLLGLLPKSLQNAHTPLLREQALAQAIADTYPRKAKQATTEAPSHLPTRRPFSPTLEPVSAAETNIFFADYQPFSVIDPWMTLLASLYTTHVRKISIGITAEGRDIPALRVGVHPTNDDDPNPPKRKTILVAGGLHAREWISTTTVDYIAYSLITGYGKVSGVTKLLEAFDFVLVPTLNPDGYIYTWETDRLWRKNRQETGLRFCKGMDLDKAFGYAWAATDNPCSESYAGSSAFEATEAKAFGDWAKNETKNNNVDFVGFLDLHSYSQQILYPYAYSCDETPPGLENLEEVAYGIGKAIRMTHGHNYEVMPACEGNMAFNAKGSKQHLVPRIEQSGGSALDFFYHSIGTRYAYQIKLRDRGTYGFLLPRDNIIPVGKETLNAVLYFGGFLSDLYDQDRVEVEMNRPGLEEESANEELKKAVEEMGRDGGNDDDDDDSWVLVKDLDPDDVNWDLKRRRRR